MSKKILASLIAGMLLVSVASPAGAATSLECTAARLVNGTRAAHDLRVVALRHRLMRHAERQARRMARQRRLSHSSLDISGFNALGEIVGTSDTVRRVHRAFLRSRPHRRIMLGRWRWLGVGVVRRGQRVYVAEIYAR
jgi:uncharacterized protein YkwD